MKVSVAGVQPGTWEEMRLAKSAGLSGAVGICICSETGCDYIKYVVCNLLG